jgi:hypothetical protein
MTRRLAEGFARKTAKFEGDSQTDIKINAAITLLWVRNKRKYGNRSKSEYQALVPSRAMN